jgi:hypothetical protein
MPALHTFAARAVRFMAASAASASRLARTDAASRGFIISFDTLERISLSFSVKIFVFTVSPLF